MQQEQAFLSNLIALNQNISRLVQATGQLPVLPSYTVASATAYTTAGVGTMIYVTNETGGAVPAFFDGTNWRRVTDRAIIS
jgi:hypothetical protein